MDKNKIIKYIFIFAVISNVIMYMITKNSISLSGSVVFSCLLIILSKRKKNN